MKDFTKVIRYSWGLKRYYLSIAALVVFLSLLAQADPFLIKFIVEGLGKVHSSRAPGFGYFAWLVGGILAVGVITAVVSNIQGYLGDRLGAKLNTFLSQRYYDHVLSLPLEYYDNEVAGRITSRLERSIVTVSQLMNNLANNFVGMILTVVISLSIIGYYAWPVAVLLVILIPVYIWLTSLSSKGWQKHQDVINKHTDVNNGRFIETLGQIRVVKSFVQETVESGFFAGRRRDIESETKTQSVGWHIYDIYRRLSLAVVLLGIYSYITWQAVVVALSISDFVLLLQLISAAQWPLYGASFIIDALQRAQAGSKDFFEVMDTKPSIMDASDASELVVSKGAVAFRDIRFAYQDGKTVMDGVSFTIEPGTKVALVGESGEGKTTITNLLLRFYALDGGSISLDGVDISGVTQASLRRQIGVVFQEPNLFSGTIKENIGYGSSSASDEDVITAAKAANAHGFIQKLANGYDSEIGERGVKLSGGQKQRIAIARAILKNPPILILDEATSSLDSRSEHEVQLALAELMKGRTTLIIAHRLSTIASVDKIVGIQNGKVAEEGTPDQLAQGNGIYAELLALQQPTAANKAKLKRYDLAR